MIGKILPILLALIGLGAGIGGGVMLRPPPQMVAMENPCGDPNTDHAVAEAETHDGEAEESSFDYVKLNNQFVIPVVDQGRVGALVVMSLSLEVAPGQSEAIYRLEPKLRDMFLQVLFDHANTGGFSGAFTRTTQMNVLRTALRETARKMLGDTVSDVLIIDVVRQDA